MFPNTMMVEILVGPAAETVASPENLRSNGQNKKTQNNKVKIQIFIKRISHMKNCFQTFPFLTCANEDEGRDGYEEFVWLVKIDK